MIDAVQPLISDRGVVYGALEVGLPLKAVEMATARVQRRGVLIVIGAAALPCLLALPLWLRVARSEANDWIPGRRKALRVCRAALEHGAVELVYQPQIEPYSRRVTVSRHSSGDAGTASWSRPRDYWPQSNRAR